MVIALLILLAATVGTGLVAYGDRGKGPLADAGPLIVRANADEDGDVGSRGRGERAESVLGELHSTLANITVALVIVHILGVGLASVVHRENLVAAMVNGKKRAGNGN